MGLLDRLIGNKKNIPSVLLSAEKNLFDLYGVTGQVDQQKLKAAVYFCIAGIALLSELGNKKPSLRPNIRSLIDNLISDTRDLTKSLTIKAGDICNDSEDQEAIETIIAENFNTFNIDHSTMLNGLIAFDALYNVKVRGLVEGILAHNNGPLGSTGYAAIVVADGVFGVGASKEYMIEVADILNNFIMGLIKTI